MWGFRMEMNNRFSSPLRFFVISMYLRTVLAAYRSGLSSKNGKINKGCTVPGFDVFIVSGILISRPAVDLVMLSREIKDNVCARCAVHRATRRIVLLESVGKSRLSNGCSSASLCRTGLMSHVLSYLGLEGLSL